MNRIGGAVIVALSAWVSMSSAAEMESLGTVSFTVSCSPQVGPAFNRGVALLHDFWYDEAERQFKKIAALDPQCAMAHWGVAMSSYHQIWNRPDEDTLSRGAAELGKAVAPASARERAYIAAASRFFRPGNEDYQSRAEAYSAAMEELYRRYPRDVDAGAFYALSLLAAAPPDDTSLAPERKALAVLRPLDAAHPDNPGVLHYVIHACDNPALAREGLAAARRYGEIAASGAHAVHMPSHIFARLGLWSEDIRANEASVAASQAAQALGESDGMDQLHSDDFLLYAYLQSGQEARARAKMDETAALLTHYESMPAMGSPFMRSMFPYYRAKLPAFYFLEMRDWQSAAALEPVPQAEPETQLTTFWARAVARGHLHQALEARADLASFESLMDRIRRGKNAFLADSTGSRIVRGEILAWVAYAESHNAEALDLMRRSADLQDKVGQGEVDIPAREMLADMLLEMHQPAQALAQYERALELSPKRFNGLYDAGLAAEGAGDRQKAANFFAALLASTDNGSQSRRSELQHAKSFVHGEKVASN